MVNCGENVLRSDDRSLPRPVGEGLLMRRATAADTEALAAFNVRLHSDDPDSPELWLGEWTRDLMGGNHPTVGPEDITVVTDENAGGRIVSSVALISQTWRYDDVTFGVGRPELIATDEQYRRRGLVRAQMDVVHRWSAERSQLVQAIVGIPWYYRMFGYEMALEMGGSSLYPYDRLQRLEPAAAERFAVREAGASDFELLDRLYARHCADSLVSRVRSEDEWRYEMLEAHASSTYRRNIRVVRNTGDGRPVGYFEFANWRRALAVREIAALPGASLRVVAIEAARYLKDLIDHRQTAAGEGDASEHDASGRRAVVFAPGPGHPVLRALEDRLVDSGRPYAWYLRVADLPAFLWRIQPVLERRLAESVIAGHSGRIRLNFFTEQMTLEFERGRLMEIGAFTPQHLHDGDAAFPGLTFLQLLFGFRSLSELRHAFPDCYAGGETALLLDILFPRRHSYPVGLG